MKTYGHLAFNRSWTVTGEPVGALIDRTLREAWGPTPPRIDLFLRAGCGAATELQMLYPSIELFWPSFLGEVVVVLDDGDQETPEVVLPPHIQKSEQSCNLILLICSMARLLRLLTSLLHAGSMRVLPLRCHHALPLI